MYYHKITEYEIKCCMHSHHGVPRAPSSRGELYGHKTLFLDDFPIFFYYTNGTWTHPPTSKLFLDFWNLFNFAKPLSMITFEFMICVPICIASAVYTQYTWLCLLSDDFPLSCNVDRPENGELCVSDRGKAVGSTARNEVKYIFKSFKLSENDHCTYFRWAHRNFILQVLR